MGSYFYSGKCPWLTLGVQENASPSCVRDAYLKLALRWHPDQNKGCANARHRFQQIKEAFEEIQRRQTAAKDSRPHYTGHSHTTSSSNTSSRYRYKAPPNNAYKHNSFYNFRRDSRVQKESPSYASASEYARAQKYGWERSERQSWDRVTFRNVNFRSRIMPQWGVGLGLVLGSVVFGLSFFSLNTLWKINNRGRSFEELMERLNSNSGVSRPTNSHTRLETERDKRGSK